MVDRDYYEPEISQEEKNWGVIAHLSPLLILIIPGLGAILGPLLVYLLKKDDGKFIRSNAVEVLNFQISILIYTIVSIILMLILIGFLIAVAIGILWLVCLILGAVKASEGVQFKYPLTIAFLK